MRMVCLSLSLFLSPLPLVLSQQVAGSVSQLGRFLSWVGFSAGSVVSIPVPSVSFSNDISILHSSDLLLG